MSSASSLLTIRSDRDLAIACAVTAGVLATALVGAWIFEWLGYKPCPLCLQQRAPYHVGIPFAAVLAALAWRGAPACVLQGGAMLLTILLVWSAGLGVFHSGVEWGWWPGPTDCAAAPATIGSAVDLLSAMRAQRIVPCDEAAWRFFGTLSLAGFNALISAALAGLVALTALGRPPLAPTTSRR